MKVTSPASGLQHSHASSPPHSSGPESAWALLLQAQAANSRSYQVCTQVTEQICQCPTGDGMHLWQAVHCFKIPVSLDMAYQALCCLDVHLAKLGPRSCVAYGKQNRGDYQRKFQAVPVHAKKLTVYAQLIDSIDKLPMHLNRPDHSRLLDSPIPFIVVAVTSLQCVQATL